MGKQLDLFEESPIEDLIEDNFSPLDYVFVKEKTGYRMVHSYYRSSHEGQVISAEEAMKALSLCSTFNIYAVVCFSETCNLPRRKH